MTDDTLPPLFFEPVYQSYIWGGNRIPRLFRRPLPNGVYAESWEISTRPEGMSVVAEGPLQGQTLDALVRIYGARLLGHRLANAEAPAFPLLLKLIDARERLSLQVHPSEETAKDVGGEAKTELWYVLAADPGSGVFAGLQPDVDRAAIEKALDETNCEPLLQRHDAAPGDAFFIPAGTVHAIDAGCLLLEIQQNSNTTYRLHDWGRVGPDGKPRETHRDQALSVLDMAPERADVRCVREPLPPQGGAVRTQIHHSRWFRIEHIEARARWSPADSNGDFEIWFLCEGRGTLRWSGGTASVTAGRSVLIPAETPGICFLPEEAGTALVRIRPGKEV